LGGFCPLLYAETNPEKVLALAPIATVVSGQMSLDYKLENDPDSIATWQETGWQVSESKSKPGTFKRLKWSHMADRVRYDALPHVSALIMPVLLVVGSKDTQTPPEHQEILFSKLPGPKELHVIAGMRHTPYEEGDLAEFEKIFRNWVERTLS
jgi:pimeloyl-ACP methyl ester carboxylesterase